jgi:V/A-type H+-transporting ATPase subunit E
MDKIQELTTKLYAEGVEKGKEEADRMIAEANVVKQQILDEAHARAAEILATAEKEHAALKIHTEAELKLYAARSSEALKTEITNLVTDRLATMNVKAATEDKMFMQQLIVELVQNWAKDEKLSIGVENAKELETYIASNVRSLLDKGLTIESVNNVKTGFTISPEDRSYKVRFGEEEFIAYFREFLRPQIQKLLF